MQRWTSNRLPILLILIGQKMAKRGADVSPRDIMLALWPSQEKKMILKLYNIISS